MKAKESALPAKRQQHRTAAFTNKHLPMHEHKSMYENCPRSERTQTIKQEAEISQTQNEGKKPTLNSLISIKRNECRVNSKFTRLNARLTH
jgi:hypothetical protein